jgi:sporulation protein YlmC with PRC-barrel domain
MKLKMPFLAAAIFASGLAFPAQAAKPSDPSPTPMGAEKQIYDFTRIQVKNFDDEPLGRIKDLAIDLVNGRIVAALIVCDSSLGFDKPTIVAVPPLALIPDQFNQIYRLNVSPEVFKSAAPVDLKNWVDSGRSASLAAAYKLFGQDPYFLEDGAKAPKADARPKVALGYVERSSKVLDLPVGNFQGLKFGKVWSLTLDIPKGRILNVIVLAPGNFKTKSIIPAMALSFNTERDALLLDDTKMEYADEPRYVFTEAAYGQDATSQEESYKGPRTTVALEQGTSYRDVDRTVLINQQIRTAKINGRNVQIGTNNGRVTLRGWVYAEDDKRRIGEIAVAASRLELVDNQIVVGKPVVAN